MGMTIEEQLKQTWRQERRFCHLRGMGRSVIWLVTLVLIGLLIDWGLLFKARMPAAVSVTLGIASLLTMLWVIWRDWLSRLRPYDATRIALDVEARHPELMSSLVSYTQLEGMKRGSHASPELLDAMRDFAISKSHQLKFSDIIDFSQVRKLTTFATIVLLIAAASSLRWSDHFGALFKRMAGIETTYPLQTRLIAISGDMIVPIGKSVVIDASAGGVIPENAVLHLNQADAAGSWNELPMEKLDNGFGFRRELESPDRDMRYFVTMGDYRSAEFRITVVRAPRVVNAELELTFPAYLNRAPETTDQLNLEVPEGTRIDWKLTCDKPVGKLAILHAGQRLDAGIGEGGKEINFSITADQMFNYTFEWTEAGSGNSFQFADIEYNVRVVKDAPPRLTYLGETPNGPATVGKTSAIQWQAQDDHGLDKVWLVFSVSSQSRPEESPVHLGKGRILLHDLKGQTAFKDVHDWKLADDILTLGPGQLIDYHLEATDLRPDESGERIVSTPVRRLSIVSSEDYLDWFRRELTIRNEAVNATFIAQRNASKQIKKQLSEPEGGQK
jgi:hypothetical protein